MHHGGGTIAPGTTVLQLAARIANCSTVYFQNRPLAVTALGARRSPRPDSARPSHAFSWTVSPLTPRTARDQIRARRDFIPTSKPGCSHVAGFFLPDRFQKGRLPFRPRPSTGRAPPKIPKCSRKRLACSFGGRSSTLSASRLKSLGRSLAFCSVGRAGRSSWSSSSSRTNSGSLRNFWMHL